MSWREAQKDAEEIYTGLRAQHDAGFVRMVIRALERILNRDERNEPRSDDRSHKDTTNRPASRKAKQ